MAEDHALLVEGDDIHVEHALKRRKCIRYLGLAGVLIIVAAGLVSNKK